MPTGAAADGIGFDGFHIDTYGYPRSRPTAMAPSIDMRLAYESFLDVFRSERPADLVSFNQVNGVPSALELAPGPASVTARSGRPTAAGDTSRACMDRSAGAVGSHRRAAPWAT